MKKKSIPLIMGINLFICFSGIFEGFASNFNYPQKGYGSGYQVYHMQNRPSSQSEYDFRNQTNRVDLYNPSILSKLVHHFAPLVFLHPRERFFPCDIEFYLEDSDLYQGDPKGRSIFITDFTGKKVDLLGNYSERDKFFLKPRLSGPDLGKFYLGFAPNPHKEYVDAPMYVNVVFNQDQSHVILQVWFFYSFNGPTIESTILGPRKGRISGIGAHQSDWEHVDIYLRRKRQVTEGMDISEMYFIERIFYAAHGEMTYGKYKNAREIEFRQFNGEVRPVVYSSLNSHASKYSPRTKDTQLDTADYDGTPQRTWVPDNIVLVAINGEVQPGQHWINYGGIWGGDGNRILNPGIQNYWLHRYGQRTEIIPTFNQDKNQKIMQDNQMTEENPLSLTLAMDPQTGRSVDFDLRKKIPTRVETLCFLMQGATDGTPYVIMGKRTIKKDQQVFGPFMSGQTRCYSRVIRGKETARSNDRFIDQQFSRLYASVPNNYAHQVAGARVKIWAAN